MMGMSSVEWSRYMHDMIGLEDPPEEISAEVVRRLEATYCEELPLVEGATEAVARLAERWPLAVASSSNRPIIDLVLRLSGLDRFFRATVSSEEVPRGKPSPDVYLEAARRLGADPERSTAIEDSRNGILSARAAGMRVVAIPNAPASALRRSVPSPSPAYRVPGASASAVRAYGKAARPPKSVSQPPPALRR
jgi:HAD superfamily hydrolase (TIGR01509 family)